MKLAAILRAVGAGIIRNTVPGGGLLVDALNAALPNDSQLTADATVADIQGRLDGLPAEQRDELLEREFNLRETELTERYSTLRTMLESDATNPHTTRPKIALGSFYVVTFASVISILLWAYGIVDGDKDLLATVTDGWPFVLSVIGPFVTLLWAYFGILSKEQRNRLSAATGSPLTGVVGSILKTLTKGGA